MEVGGLNPKIPSCVWMTDVESKQPLNPNQSIKTQNPKLKLIKITQSRVFKQIYQNPQIPQIVRKNPQTSVIVNLNPINVKIPKSHIFWSGFQICQAKIN